MVPVPLTVHFCRVAMIELQAARSLDHQLKYAPMIDLQAVRPSLDHQLKDSLTPIVKSLASTNWDDKTTNNEGVAVEQIVYSKRSCL